MSEWTRCTDAMPPLELTTDQSMRESARVLVYGYPYGSPQNRRERGRIVGDDYRPVIVVAQLSERPGRAPRWTDEYAEFWWELDAVTHWMPLPTTPKHG